MFKITIYINKHTKARMRRAVFLCLFDQKWYTTRAAYIYMFMYVYKLYK